MNTQKGQILREKATILKMIQLYCEAHHSGIHGKLCSDCEQLYFYANARINNCIYGEEKPTCQNCIIHCYSANNREKIKIVMRYSGPRMIYKFPILAINHIINKAADKKKIPKIEAARIKKMKK